MLSLLRVREKLALDRYDPVIRELTKELCGTWAAAEESPLEDIYPLDYLWKARLLDCGSMTVIDLKNKKLETHCGKLVEHCWGGLSSQR